MRVTIDDEIYDQIGDDATLGVLLTKALPLKDTHALVISGEQRGRLADLLGGLPIRSAADLLAKTERLADLRIGKHRVDLSPQQWEAIDAKAARQGKSRDEYLQQMVQQFLIEWTEIAVRA